MKDFFRELNRPAHLARRDVAVERAVEFLCLPVAAMNAESRVAHVDRVLSLLRTALEHADLAARSARTTQRERDFRRFLDLVLHNVTSLHALVENQAHFESEKQCFLDHFLGDRTEESALSAVNYQRRAEDMLQALWQIMRLSHAPYRAMQEENLAELTQEERERYRRGSATYRESLPDPARPQTA